MLKFLADENFHNHVIRGLRRHHQHVDVVRVQEVGLDGVDDPSVLEWAAQHGRVLLTHDVRTLRPFAEERIGHSLPMSGIIFVPQPFSKPEIIEELALIAECYEPAEMENSWRYLPL